MSKFKREREREEREEREERTFSLDLSPRLKTRSDLDMNPYVQRKHDHSQTKNFKNENSR